MFAPSRLAVRRGLIVLRVQPHVQRAVGLLFQSRARFTLTGSGAAPFEGVRDGEIAMLLLARGGLRVDLEYVPLEVLLAGAGERLAAVRAQQARVVDPLGLRAVGCGRVGQRNLRDKFREPCRFCNGRIWLCREVLCVEPYYP